MLITRGSRGMALFERGRPTVHIPIVGSDQIADVTGAGDTVIATMTLALSAGAPFEDAARLANHAGGLVVMKRGTATVGASELRYAISGGAIGRAAGRLGVGRVLSREELAAAVGADRAAGRTVAFANGCFDLLHVGHVRYLQAAAREADRLVVAINDDQSVAGSEGAEPAAPVGRRPRRARRRAARRRLRRHLSRADRHAAACSR